MALPTLHRGDVLFTMATDTFMRKVIFAAQTVGSLGGGGSAADVHAAIVVRSGQTSAKIVESVGSGVHMGDVKDGTYHLFHYTANDELRRYAARVAEGFAAYAQDAPGEYGKYNTLSAALSPFQTTRTGQRPTTPNSPFTCGPTRFFCSNLVFLAYAGAAEIMGLQKVPIGNGHKDISPRDLMAGMANDPDWKALGVASKP